MVAPAISPADDHLQHNNILADGRVHVLLHFSQIVHEALEAVFVEILKRHVKVWQSVLSLPVTERLQIISDCFVLLPGLLCPVVKLTRICLIFVIYVPKRGTVFGTLFLRF